MEGKHTLVVDRSSEYAFEEVLRGLTVRCVGVVASVSHPYPKKKTHAKKLMAKY